MNNDNLKPFKKGQSGNPNGRPKKEYCLTSILKEQGNLEDVESAEGKISRKEAIAKKLWAMAMEGDVPCLKYIFDRLDGKPIQQIEAQINTEPDTEFKIVSKNEHT